MTDNENVLDFHIEKENHTGEIRECLKDFIPVSGKTQAATARELGVSEALLSQFLSGTYKGNVNDLTEKVKLYMESEAKKSVPPCLPGFTETSTVKGIWYAIKYAHIHGDIALIYGEAGRGKSETLKEYTRKNDKVIYIEADTTISNTKSILEEIWEVIGNKNKEPKRFLKKGIMKMQKSGLFFLVINMSMIGCLDGKLHSMRSFTAG